MASKLWYLLPLVPLLVRLVIFGTKYRGFAKQILSEEENDRDNQRTLLVALTGFTFSALFAIIVIDSAPQNKLLSPIISLLISFSCYYVAMNMQGYKQYRLHDIVTDAFYEAGNISLIQSLCSVVIDHPNLGIFRLSFVIFIIGAWFYDFSKRIRIYTKYLDDLSLQVSTKPGPKC